MDVDKLSKAVCIVIIFSCRVVNVADDTVDAEEERIGNWVESIVEGLLLLLLLKVNKSGLDGIIGEILVASKEVVVVVGRGFSPPRCLRPIVVVKLSVPFVVVEGIGLNKLNVVGGTVVVVVLVRVIEVEDLRDLLVDFCFDGPITVG